MRIGQKIPVMTLTSIYGKTISIPATDSEFIHLQFRRYSGCPICHLHLQSFSKRHDEVRAAGIHEVVVFHSPAEELRSYKAGLPFDLVADPDKLLYLSFDVMPSSQALLHPKALLAVAQGLLHMQKYTLAAPGGRLGVPADFLISRTGKIVACKYGTHADDQWSVDELLGLAEQARAQFYVQTAGITKRRYAIGLCAK